MWTVRPRAGSGLLRHTTLTHQREVELRNRCAVFDLAAGPLETIAEHIVRAVVPPVFLFRPLLFRCVRAVFLAPGTVLSLCVACLLEGDFIVGGEDSARWVEETQHVYAGQHVLEWKPRGIVFTVEFDVDTEDHV